MAAAEDLSVFFSQADFAVSATFTPAAGPAETANVIIDAPSDLLFGGEIISADYIITYPAASLPNIVAGNTGTVDGVAYKIREIQLIGDGKLKQARLSSNG